MHGEEHVLLDCPSADLANLWVKHHHLFCSPSSNSKRLLKQNFICQADTKGLALYVHECLDYVQLCLFFRALPSLPLLVSVAGPFGFSKAALVRQVQLCNLTSTFYGPLCNPSQATSAFGAVACSPPAPPVDASRVHPWSAVLPPAPTGKYQHVGLAVIPARAVPRLQLAAHPHHAPRNASLKIKD